MVIPDLDALIAEVDRTCGDAYRDADQEQPDWLVLLKTGVETAERLRNLADDLVEDYVEHCRLHGYSWAEIGAVLGVSRQAVQQRYLVPHRRYEPEELKEELRTAMAHMKEVAIRHRNNFIGTEHVLWGLLAEDNSATRLLAALDAPMDELRQKIYGRLGLGASQAAERIAWTPYSRKALATAQELAAKAGESQIGCDHLLTGLIAIGRGAACDVLAEFSVDLAALSKAEDGDQPESSAMIREET
ncbi:Clp protease N-terminal domain-containing protein [Actinocorallia sp. B10E7]|uniref:Clp protease N-terminal domain-containing protein n=1 Tax=Actinocorallia sp. B10E7 TaxID=3153558 RepID=UPI00325C8DE5